MGKTKEVHIEYCGGWGYYPRYLELADQIKSEVPEAVVNGKVGKSGAFEITMNGQLLFSKAKTGGFPVFKEIIEAVQDYSGEGDVHAITTAEAGWCSIL